MLINPKYLATPPIIPITGYFPHPLTMENLQEESNQTVPMLRAHMEHDISWWLAAANWLNPTPGGLWLFGWSGYSCPIVRQLTPCDPEGAIEGERRGGNKVEKEMC